VSLSALLYGIAFCTFMIGAGWSYRSDGRPAAVALLAAVAAMDFTLTGLVMLTQLAWFVVTSRSCMGLTLTR
jgi:uncharacterized membrane protein